VKPPTKEQVDQRVAIARQLNPDFTDMVIVALDDERKALRADIALGISQVAELERERDEAAAWIALVTTRDGISSSLGMPMNWWKEGRALVARLAGKVAAPSNCDGCARGLPVVDGMHRSPEPWDGQMCTADRYKPARLTAEAPKETPAAPKCSGCGKPLLAENFWIADGCPCYAPRGINHGRVPKDTCTCVECDPAQTGSTRYAHDFKGPPPYPEQPLPTAQHVCECKNAPCPACGGDGPEGEWFEGGEVTCRDCGASLIVVNVRECNGTSTFEVVSPDEDEPDDDKSGTPAAPAVPACKLWCGRPDLCHLRKPGDFRWHCSAACDHAGYALNPPPKGTPK
jgi:hypothetical protein